MGALQLNGKYTIKKKNFCAEVNNNLTIFGALQIARLLKKDVTFPKYKNDYYGKIISYNGQLKKISIKNGSKVSFVDTEKIFNQTNQQSDLNKIIDGSKSSFDVFSFSDDGKDTDTIRTSYFDIDLKEQINLSRIGILAEQIRLKNQYGDYISSYASDDVTELFFYVKPSGYSITDGGGFPFQGSVYEYMTGDYIKVYNPYQPTINGKQYYINNKTIGQEKVTFLYFDNQQWAIGQTLFSSFTKGFNRTAAFYKCLSTDDIVKKFGFKTANLNNGIYNALLENKANEMIETVEYKLNVCNKLNMWLKPSNRLYNYCANLSDFQYQEKYINLLADIGVQYQKGDKKQKIQYCVNSPQFDSMVAYNCYSFQQVLSVKDLYHWDNQSLMVKSQQNIVGFCPYVSSFRFCRMVGKGEVNANLKIYQIDLFVPCKSPYNPCVIGLQSNGSWVYSDFVDSIQRKGKDTVVFTKTIVDSIQHLNITGIGLFGNFSGHLDGTAPMQVQIIQENCFSYAKFAQSWDKQFGEQVVISYELTIGDVI